MCRFLALLLGVSLAMAACNQDQEPPTSPTGTAGSGSASYGTFLTFDFASNVPSSELTHIQTGIRQVQEFLTTDLGGDIPINTQMGITVKIVAAGSGNQEPGGGGSCCTALAPSGARFFFDVRHPNWDLSRPPGNATWTVQANKEKTAAHEYVHAWQWSLGGLTPTSQPLGDWLNEGLAEYVAYSTMIRAGSMREADVDAFVLSSAIATGQAGRCLSALESSNLSGAGLWPGHIGSIAVKRLVTQSPNGIRSLRIVNAEIGAGRTLDQAFQQAFGTSKQQFYDSFPAYLASLGGPGSCS